MVGWLDNRYRTKPCEALNSRHGNRSKFRTQTPPGPEVWNVVPGLDQVLTYLQSLLLNWQNYIFEHSPYQWHRRDIILTINQTRSQKSAVMPCRRGQPTRSGPGRVQVGSRVNACRDLLHLIICANDALDAWETNKHTSISQSFLQPVASDLQYLSA